MRATLIVFSAIVFSALLLSCAPQAPQKIQGRWQSDEALTLASMALVKEHMQPEHVALFENGFFGQMIIERTADSTRSYLVGEEAGEWRPYQISERGADYVVLAQKDGEETERKTRIYMEGDLLYVIVSKYQFREYFRRVAESVDAIEKEAAQD